MKRCPTCQSQFPDRYTTCPDCGKMLKTITQEELDREAELAAKAQEERKAQLAKMREDNKGAGALMAIGIMSSILDLVMVILFFASSNLGGMALCFLGLLLAILGMVFLQKPDLLSSRKGGNQSDSLTAYQQTKKAAMLLILLALALTLVQIGIQASVFADILSAGEQV